MTQQLNIRSDKAFATAKRLARALGVSTTKVVEDALAEMERRTVAPSSKVTPQQAQEFSATILELARKANMHGPLLLDDRVLFGEDGLPTHPGSK